MKLTIAAFALILGATTLARSGESILRLSVKLESSEIWFGDKHTMRIALLNTTRETIYIDLSDSVIPEAYGIQGNWKNEVGPVAVRVEPYYAKLTTGGLERYTYAVAVPSCGSYTKDLPMDLVQRPGQQTLWIKVVLKVATKPACKNEDWTTLTLSSKHTFKAKSKRAS